MSRKNSKKQTANIEGQPTQILISLLSIRWAVPVIQTLRHDTLRHYELRDILAGPAQKVLTETLRKLERSGIVERHVYPTVPVQVDYRLTPLGLELLNISEILSDWAGKYAKEIKYAQKAYDRH